VTESEADVQAAIVEFLQWEGWTVIEYAKPGGHKALGGALPPGHPDLHAFKAAEVADYSFHVWIEVKVPGKDATPKQHEYHEMLREAGETVFVSHGPEEVAEQLRSVRYEVRSTFQ
jgi:hypothetical protein